MFKLCRVCKVIAWVGEVSYHLQVLDLAKQSWRLLMKPDTRRGPENKMLPHGNSLKAGPKKGSSFTWQSIFVGLQTFRRGHIWRAGSSRQINLWEDHWIPGSPSRKVLTSKGLCVLQIIDALINPMTGQWDEAIIQDNFIWCRKNFENSIECILGWGLCSLA